MMRFPYGARVHRDGLRLTNGRELLLQGLNPGVWRFCCRATSMRSSA